MARRLCLLDMAVLARPADLPRIHFAQPLRAIFTKQRRKTFVAEPAAGRERIGKVMFPVIWCLLAQSGCDRHLRHDSGAAAPDQAPIGKNDRSPTLRRVQRRIHARATGADHEDIGFEMGGNRSIGRR